VCVCVQGVGIFRWVVAVSVYKIGLEDAEWQTISHVSRSMLRFRSLCETFRGLQFYHLFSVILRT